MKIKNFTYNFINPSLLKEALTHPSISKGDSNKKNYERLEWIGDHVLSMMISDEIFHQFPSFEEGVLSQIEANMVCTETVWQIAMKLGLNDAMILDKGEENSGGRSNKKNLENCLEALIGAVYLEQGLDGVKEHFLHLWKEFLQNTNYILQRDSKSMLQEWSQRNKLGLPNYTLLSVSGVEHSKKFDVEVNVAGYMPASAESTSIKKAQNKAAENFFIINNLNESKTENA